MTYDGSDGLQALFWPAIGMLALAIVIEFCANLVFLLAFGKELWEISFFLNWLLFCNIFLVLLLIYSRCHKRFEKQFLKLVLGGANPNSLRVFVLVGLFLSFLIVTVDVLWASSASPVILYSLYGLIISYFIGAPVIIRKLSSLQESRGKKR